MTSEDRAAPILAADPDLPDAAEVEAGRRLFAGPCDFMLGVVSYAQLPPPRLPEVAFAGRSNVGKSSLINALTGRKTLARTSNTPGRTREVNFFDLGGRLSLVDLPGYGYARVAKTQVKAWTRLIHDYLRGRVELARVCILIDARHGLKSSDAEVMDMLDTAAVSYQIVLTKADKLKPGQLDAMRRATEAAIAKRPAAHPAVVATSSEKGMGIGELRARIARSALPAMGSAR